MSNRCLPPLAETVRSVSTSLWHPPSITRTKREGLYGPRVLDEVNECGGDGAILRAGCGGGAVVGLIRARLAASPTDGEEEVDMLCS